MIYNKLYKTLDTPPDCYNQPDLLLKIYCAHSYLAPVINLIKSFDRLSCINLSCNERVNW